MRKRRSRFFGGNSVTCSVIYFQYRPQYLSTGGGRVAVANTGHFLVLYFLACCWRMQITCRGNSVGPLTRHQQCLVSLVCHLILSGDMIPLCGILSEWHHMHIGCYQQSECTAGATVSLVFVCPVLCVKTSAFYCTLNTHYRIVCNAWTEYKFTCVCVSVCPSHFLLTRLQVNGFLQLIA